MTAITEVWYRRLTNDNFFNIEKPQPQGAGGTGAQYIETPAGMVDDTLAFFGRSSRTFTVDAKAVGLPAQVAEPLEFKEKSKDGRLRIDQNRRFGTRHSAWSPSLGFPTAPASVTDGASAGLHLPPGGVRVFVAKTSDGDYWAGYTSGPEPSFAARAGIGALWNDSTSSSGGVIKGLHIPILSKGPQVASTPDPTVRAILQAWASGRSALLYGPPGTGKTRVLSELRELLQGGNTTPGTYFSVDDSRAPFASTPTASFGVSGLPPAPIKTVWLTFHQSLTYEDFVIGLRPESGGGVVSLVPHAGTLLDAVMELQEGSGTQSVVLFIDEINRGNAAKIFGEFLTFLDFDYRDAAADGSDNANKLPLPIRHLTHDEDAYVPVRRPDGSEAALAYPSYFPRHIYVVATMNSVDRTAIPIDSALARRFDRIDIRPDINLLAGLWGVDLDTLGAKAGTPTDLKAAETAILLIDRLNLSLAENFGPDFELGHGLIIELDPAKADPWAQLARIWDRVLFPQLEDRFSGRAEELANTLRVEEFGSVPYAWRYRTLLSGDSNSSVLAPVSLATIDSALARASLQLLASRSLGQ